METDVSQESSGPGLRGLFVSGEPAYQYMGPIDMSSVGFTESALDRVVTPNYGDPIESVPASRYIPSEILAQKDSPKNTASVNIAKGKSFQSNAKYLNDVYELVKNLVATRNPELAKKIAPMVLTDKADHSAIAWYTPHNHRITHPVWENLSRSQGYYWPKNTNVVKGSTSDSPEFYKDFYVNQITGEQHPVVKDVVAHEVAHSIDQDLSTWVPEIWPHIVKDFYYQPRHLTNQIERVPSAELFAEYMSDAMRTDLAERNQELQDYYRMQGKTLPYKMEKGYDTFTRKTVPETEAILHVLENRAQAVAKTPFDAKFYGPLDDESYLHSSYAMGEHLDEMRSRMYNDIANMARSEAKDAYSKLNIADQGRFSEATDVRRAKSHLDFLDWYAPWRTSDE